MFKPTPRIFLRPPISRVRVVRWRQSFSTAPPSQRSRSWKNSAIRWGLAIGGIYYYNTSNIFAEEPAFAFNPPSSPTEEASVQTLESIAPSRKPKLSDNPSPTSSPLQTKISDSPLSLDETEEEASQEGAFNEETGEINWDCPCLGGMAHGPCGEEFRTAFSCFVFSKEDPKGMDCIENFKGMQDCFRLHPDVYGGELEDDEDDTENLDQFVEPQVDEPSVFRPPPAAPFTHNPEVDEPSIYRPPPPSTSPLHPQVDEPSKIPQNPSATPIPKPVSSNDPTTPHPHLPQSDTQKLPLAHDPQTESGNAVPRVLHDTPTSNVGK